MHNFFKKIRNRFHLPQFNEAEIMYVLAAGVFVAGIGLMGWFAYQYFSKPPDTLIEEPLLHEKKPACNYRSVLDGTCVETQSEATPRLVAVMIENHYKARPQSGLSKASVVYEAPVEANYTRFLALYPKDTDVKKVGPVRSARPYYLDWLDEWGRPLYMHVGGSPEALDIIKERIIFDMNEFYRGWYYWRDLEKVAPHQVYTSSDLWKKSWDDYGADVHKTTTSSWSFGEKETCTENCVYEITVSFLPPVYEAVWKFNTSTGKYDRYQMNEPHLDDSGDMISADTVIVQRVLSERVDDIGRLHIGTIGAGEALVFRDGYMIQGRWEKDAHDLRTRFVDANSHEPIALKPGKIWIELVPQDGGVKL